LNNIYKEYFDFIEILIKLKKYYKSIGFSELKDKQINVINKLLLCNDVVGLLPTGYGKLM
jgi:superfamily II DNA helicase RecQ